MSESKFWLDIAVAEIVEKHPRGEIIVSSGVSPSGSYHVGRLREVLTADALAWGIRQTGRKAKHLHFVDDYDYFRKIPEGVPTDYEQHIGVPVYLIPDPWDCHKTYADHHLKEFLKVVDELGLEMEVLRAHELYQAGRFTEAIEQTLEGLDPAKHIIAKVSGRQMEDDWVPVQLLSDNDNLREWQFSGWDKAKKTIGYTTSDGKKGELDYSKGRVKLDWRLDWPARWSIWKVQVEPFGKDHATKGGSYDTGKELVKQVFRAEPPYPVPYEFINRVGETKKMSGSVGNVITPGEALDIMPAEILRYFILRSRPERQLFFDSGLGLYNLIEEYSKVEQTVQEGKPHEFEQAYKLSSANQTKQTISSIPFSHLVSAYQAASGDTSLATEILKRTGYKAEASTLEHEFNFVKNWLDKYAPEEVKFSVQEELPKAELSNAQKDFLAKLAEAIESTKEVEAQAVHDTIYKLAEEFKLPPGEAFKAIYRVILGKDSGPKAGWFLTSLDRAWLVKRLQLKS